MHQPVEIIAEVASNFDNDLDVAKSYIRKAKECGASAVKFQTLKMDHLFSPQIELEGSGEIVPNPRLKIENLELPESWHFELNDFATELGIEFMSTPFHLEAVNLLEQVGVRRYKISSGDLTFHPLLIKVAQTGKPIILSTGASYLEEVKESVAILEQHGCTDLTLLHCTSTYPPQSHELNLNAIKTLKATFPHCKVGLSDHSPGTMAPVIATSLGAQVIEKHYTLTPEGQGPDHKFAASADEFKQMIEQIRETETMLGDGVKEPKEAPQRRVRIRRIPRDPQTGLPDDSDNARWLRPAGPVTE